MLCKRCGERVPENVKELYHGYCTWTCLSLQRKEEEEEARYKIYVKCSKKMMAEEQKRMEKEAAARDAAKKEPVKICKKREKKKEKAHAAILQLNANGDLIRRFDSADEAAESMGSAKANVYYACAHGSRHKGFFWQYEKNHPQG